MAGEQKPQLPILTTKGNVRFVCCYEVQNGKKQISRQSAHNTNSYNPDSYDGGSRL
jgi:hypothetical protein